MGKPSDRENNSHSCGEVFRAYLTDSQDSLEQPKGDIRDLFKKRIGKGTKGGDGKTFNSPEPPQGNSPVRLTSKQKE